VLDEYHETAGISHRPGEGIDPLHHTIGVVSLGRCPEAANLHVDDE